MHVDAVRATVDLRCSHPDEFKQGRFES